MSQSSRSRCEKSRLSAGRGQHLDGLGSTHPELSTSVETPAYITCNTTSREPFLALDKKLPPMATDVSDAAESEPDGWQCEPEVGMIVRLHSLSREDLNGKLGECTKWDAAKERWGVRLCETDSSLAVRPVNLLRAPPASAAASERAFLKVEEASEILAQARRTAGQMSYGVSGPGLRYTNSDVFQRVEALLQEAERDAPASVNLHQLRGDMCHMRGDMHGMVTHMRRAVANGHGLRAADGHDHQNKRRVALAGALGNIRDLEGEAEQLRIVLKREPGHLHARLSLGQNLIDRQLIDDAIPELMMAVQLPNSCSPPMPPQQHAAFLQHARSTLCNTLGRQAQQQMAQGEHARAVETLEGRLLKVPGLEPNMRARTEANLAVSLCALHEHERAAAATDRARAVTDASPVVRAYAVCTAAQCKEQTGDAAEGAVADSLYAEAKELYRAAHGICADEASRQGFARVQAKCHPDIEWVKAAGLSSPGYAGGGAARSRRADVTVADLIEQLP